MEFPESEWTLDEVVSGLRARERMWAHWRAEQVGWEDAARYLRVKSGNLFADDKDDDAITIRDLAEELLKSKPYSSILARLKETSEEIKEFETELDKRGYND